MNTLGFAILNILGGTQKPNFTRNIDNSILREVSDIRSSLNDALQIEYQQEPILKIIKVSKQGTFVIIYKFYDPAKGLRNGDGLSVWVYVPNEVRLNDVELYSLINDIENRLAQKGIQERELNDQIEMLFENIKYNSPGLPSVNLIFSPKGYAYRYVDEAQNNEIDVFNDLYQDYYCKYRFIFLLKRTDPVIKISNKSSENDDLTERDLESFDILNVPSITNNTSIYLVDRNNNESPFNQPIRAKNSDRFKLVFRRDGFEDYEKSGTVESLNEQNIQPIWKKKFNKNQFVLKDTETDRELSIEKATIRIKNQALNPSILLNETELENWERFVDVSSQDFDVDKIVRIDYSKYNQKYIIWVQRLLHECEFNVIGDSDTTIIIRTSKKPQKQEQTYKFDWRRKDARLVEKGSTPPPKRVEQQNPPPYYVIGDEDNSNPSESRLKRIAGFVVKHIWKLLAVLIALAIVLLGIKFLKSCSINPKPEVPAAIEEPIETDSSKTNNEIVNYLDNHDTWEKSEMDNLAYGMWDLINNMNTTALQEQYPDVIKGSMKLTTLVNLMTQLKDSFQYCNNGDTSIKYDRLYNRIKNKIDQQERSSYDYDEAKPEPEPNGKYGEVEQAKVTKGTTKTNTSKDGSSTESTEDVLKPL